jgi:cytochrome c biogenesis protein CcmG, thiol:disulfide interchange protein DsbE
VTRRRWWLWSPLVLLLIAVTSACTSGSGSQSAAESTPSPFASCAALTAPPASTTSVPDVRIPCFTGGQQVALRQIKGPAVINLWASWCGPCRVELPLMQQLAEKTAGRLQVIGVDTGDRRDAGASFAAAKGVKMPTLLDEDQTLLKAIGSNNLPVTIFVDANGRSFVHRLPLDTKTLPDQVRERTGVTVDR